MQVCWNTLEHQVNWTERGVQFGKRPGLQRDKRSRRHLPWLRDTGLLPMWRLSTLFSSLRCVYSFINRLMHCYLFQRRRWNYYKNSGGRLLWPSATKPPSYWEMWRVWAVCATAWWVGWMGRKSVWPWDVVQPYHHDLRLAPGRSIDQERL